MARRSCWTAIVVVAAMLLAAGCSSGTSSARVTASTPSTGSGTPGANRVIPLSSLTGRIVFARAGGEFQDDTIFVANADGTDARQLTTPGEHCCPRWAPDGQHVLMAASARDQRITTGIIAVSGGAIQTLPLPVPALNLMCANGGQSAVTHRYLCEGFNDSQPKLGGIYTANASGGDLVRITPCCGPQDDLAVGFSPDGRRVYVYRPNAAFPMYGDIDEGSVFVADADGSLLRQVTPNTLPVEPVGNGGARLSPDGRHLLFASDGAIWMINPDGSGPTKVFQDAQGRLAISPTYSPDGRFILFGLDPAGQLGFERNPPDNGLYVIRADGTDLTPVIVSNDFKLDPDWTAH